MVEVQDAPTPEPPIVRQCYFAKDIAIGNKPVQIVPENKKAFLTNFFLEKMPIIRQFEEGEEINFEWPTEEMMKKLLSNVRLQSIMFERDRLAVNDKIADVRITLSNGLSSKAKEKFLNPPNPQNVKATKGYNFDVNRPVKFFRFEKEQNHQT